MGKRPARSQDDFFNGLIWHGRVRLRGASLLKITDVKATVLDGNFNWIIVRVDTDEGISGYGEMRNHFATQTETYADPRELDAGVTFEGFPGLREAPERWRDDWPFARAHVADY